jgi:two-component system chemotaxis response regulator CheY
MPHSFLVIDDSKLHQKIYKLAFAQAGMSNAAIYFANNGKEGFGLLVKHPELTMVSLDLNMPEMNGLELLERRRAEKLHEHIPIVLVTTEGTPEDEARGRAAGAWEYLRKPFKPSDVQGVITRALKQSQSRTA